jgi:hypothetical protein
VTGIEPPAPILSFWSSVEGFQLQVELHSCDTTTLNAQMGKLGCVQLTFGRTESRQSLLIFLFAKLWSFKEDIAF